MTLGYVIVCVVSHAIFRDAFSFTQVTIYEELVTEGGLTFVQSILELCSVETMDSGEYSCIVESGATSDTEVTQLTVVDNTGVYVHMHVYVHVCV